MSTKTLKKLETAGENKKARHKAGLPTGAQFISDEKRYHADAETQVPLDSATVSYTHLDVYKRQAVCRRGSAR